MPKKFEVRGGGFPDGVLVDECDKWLGDRYTWHVNKDGYVITYIRHDGEHFGLRLHHAIMCPQKGQVVDHIFHNPLDCRRSQMRCVDSAENNFNRKGAPSQSSTGIRNVGQRPDGTYWVRVQYRGKMLQSQKRYTSLSEAASVAERLRAEVVA